MESPINDAIKLEYAFQLLQLMEKHTFEEWYDLVWEQDIALTAIENMPGFMRGISEVWMDTLGEYPTQEFEEVLTRVENHVYGRNTNDGLPE